MNWERNEHWSSDNITIELIRITYLDRWYTVHEFSRPDPVKLSLCVFFHNMQWQIFSRHYSMKKCDIIILELKLSGDFEWRLKVNVFQKFF